jgi:GNAT superfamily N-acetyltransferase
MLSFCARRPPVRQLAPADLAGLVALQEAVHADCPPGFLQPRSEAELIGHLDGTRGVAYGIAKGGALAATALLTLPNPAEAGESLEAEIARRGVTIAAGLRERVGQEDWARATGFLGHAMVRRDARGRGYQRALFTALLAHAAAANLRWVFSGVHLANAASWRNLLALGMAIVVVRPDPGHPMIGLIRAVGAPALASDAGDRLTVAAHEPSQHQVALMSGYVGRSIGATGIVYEKILPGVLSSDSPLRRSVGMHRGIVP